MSENGLWKELRAAIQNGDVEGTLALIGGDKSRLERQTIFGTPLHVAASAGQLEIVKRLVELGADLNARGGIPLP